MTEILSHPFAPVFRSDSRVLILGSFPSVKSRQNRFYYGHPQNRFWPLMAALFEEDIPVTIDEKTGLLLRHRLALWDCARQCEITGSSDASIRNVAVNDLSVILNHSQVECIACNGQTAGRLYRKAIAPAVGREALILPSTSPANARWTLPMLIEAWMPIRDFASGHIV